MKPELLFSLIGGALMVVAIISLNGQPTSASIAPTGGTRRRKSKRKHKKTRSK